MKSLSAICVFLMILTLSSLPGLAASSAVLQVSATIRPWVSFNAVQNMRSYRVTTDDIRRGYVDLAGSITLEVRTNIDKEISVRFSSEGGEKILFKESNGSAYFENAYSLDPGRQMPMQVINRKIDSRIMLSSSSKEGDYPLSVFMSPEI